jgi:hypothetical protein
MTLLWEHTDENGEQVSLHAFGGGRVRFATGRSGAYLDADSAVQLIGALVSQFGLTTVTAEPNKSVRLCGEGFRDHGGVTRVCDVVADHIGGHQRIAPDESAPEPEVSVQDRIMKEHTVDRVHYTAQFNHLGGLIRAQSQQNAGTHEMLAEQLGKIGDRTRATSHELGDIARLLTEIRDRLPEPAPSRPRCGHIAPITKVPCERDEGHEGRHGAGDISWPRYCGDPCPYGGADCNRALGHLGDHSNVNTQHWYQERCGDRGLSGALLCELDRGHSGRHREALSNW